MKQKDFAMILVIVFISAIVSYFLSNAIIASPKNRKTKVEIVEPISADFPPPDGKYFNANALDPTLVINIGDNTNPKPFNGQ